MPSDNRLRLRAGRDATRAKTTTHLCLGEHVTHGALTLAQPIDGYTPIERLGAGGYGEVWKAEAPGGLVKAMKFVYGRLDDARAAREMKALNRVKQVRHPFLLSLERIEIVDGQLVIVTELADMSLKDRFEACREEGLPGIDRGELHVYLRDAADALDYMREKFSLQHLDVKPENLLLVGGRVKVADFGLVKELHEASMSMMGGMTPVYAPPEVFDDRACETSDQYSLAIVYQEMLTGVLPFPGRTPAQLAAQHLHSPPMLGALPAEDRPAIARALSKNPSDRFPSCKAMVECLLRADRPPHEVASPPSSAESPGASNLETATIASGDTKLKGDRESDAASHVRPAEAANGASRTEALAGNPPSALSESGARLPLPSIKPAPVYDLPPIEVPAGEIGLRPTVFVAIGGTAAAVVLALRRRLHDRFGPLDAIPTFDTLLFDTDRRALEQVIGADPAIAMLAAHQTLAMPLRRPREYREDSTKFLRWLSRRWLYNIPRSLETEGIRPLGRLALVDHAERLMARLRHSIERVTDDTSIATSTESTGLKLRDPAPRVFVIASVSGGTGSGMVLDVGFALRKILGELELPDDGLCAVLAHWTGHDPAAADLAIANAYACLTELYHYDRADRAYPGDAAMGLPACRPEQTPFEDVYFTHFGDDLSHEDYASRIESLATYLYLDATTAAGTCFDVSRALARGSSQSAPRELQLRTFGLSEITCDVARAAEGESNRVCRKIVQRWIGQADSSFKAPPGSAAPVDEDVERVAEACACSSHLDVDQLLEHLYQMVERTLGHDAESFARQVLEEPASDRQAVRGGVSLAAAVASISAALSPDESTSADDESAPNSVQMALADHIELLSREQSQSMRRCVMSLVDNPAARWAAAVHAKDWFLGHLQALREQLETLRHETDQQLAEIEQQLIETDRRTRRRGKSWPRRILWARRVPVQVAPLKRFCELRLREIALAAVADLIDANSKQFNTVGDELSQIRRALDCLAEFFHPLPADDKNAGGKCPASSDAPDLTVAVQCALHESLTHLTGKVDQQFQQQFLAPQGGLSSVVAQSSDVVGTLSDALRLAAWVTMRDAAMKVDSAALFQESHDGAADQLLKRCYDSAVPPLLDIGGSKRMVVVMPRGDGAKPLHRMVRDVAEVAPTFVLDNDRGITFCCEAERIAVSKVAAMLVQHHPASAMVANRIHVRGDIDWTEFELPR